MAALAAAALVISAIHHLTAPARIPWHNILQVLYYSPCVLAALLFGWRVGLLVSAVAAASHIPYIIQIAGETPDHAIEQSVEMALLCVVAFLTGVLSDRDHRQRRELERTTRELSEVYRKLQQNFEQMKRAERLFAVGQLAAGLAHELRNPLWSLSGAAGILHRNVRLEPKHQECIEIIQREAQRLSRLLTEFLHFARPRPPKFQSIQVDALLVSVGQLAAHAASGKAVRVATRTANGLPAVEGDPEMIRQMLLNLAINAVQAMPDGGDILLSADMEDNRVRIAVRDQGCGIDPEVRDRIFDPFFTTKHDGTGLGLAVAHQIVEQHGGTLKLEANADRGMTFSVLLPIVHEGLV